MTDPEPFNLARFVTAQAPVFATVIKELKAGRKRTHWMWFVFPQLSGLGHSPTAQFYGIASLEEACAYLDHPMLGPRLELCTRTVLEVKHRSLHEIFGSPDDMKFRSSMTLFAAAAADRASLFQEVLDRCWAGTPDEQTLRLLAVDDWPGAKV